MVSEGTLSILLAVLMAGSVVVSCWLAWYSWRRASHPISDTFALVMGADGAWALFTLCSYLSPTETIALLWPVPMTAAASFGSVIWFMFVTRYTADSEWIPSAVETGLLVLAGLYTVAFAVNPSNIVHQSSGVATYGAISLAYPEPGPVLLLYTLFTYVVLAITFGLLGRFLLRTRNLYRKQAGVIFAVTFLVIVSTVLYVAGISPHPQLVVTPIFFVVQAAGIGAALYRYDFLDVEPMAAHTLLDEMADPVIVVDSTDQLVDWNQAAEAYIERNGDRLTINDVSIPELQKGMTSPDGGGGAGTTTVSTTAPHDGQEQLTFDVRTTAIEDRYGILRGRAVVLRDVTAQEQRKHALETQNERLEEFTGIVSHDLRNPLQVIEGHLELASETGDLSDVEQASEVVDRMERLLDDLLHLAQQGRIIEETTPVSLASCAQEAWAVVGSGDASLSVETDRTIHADADRLQQAFENLFRNAVEHGGETVIVGDTDDGFHVEDDGPGIPEDDRETVFEFGVTTSEDGTGFGLAIVERVVEAHGWTIAVTEGDSGGARFEVSVADGGPTVFDG